MDIGIHEFNMGERWAYVWLFGTRLHFRVQRERDYAGTTFVIGVGMRLFSLYVR
jgi:hypothetical protein